MSEIVNYNCHRSMHLTQDNYEAINCHLAMPGGEHVVKIFVLCLTSF